MKTIIHNIGTLAGILPADVRKLEGSQMNSVECIENAYLVIEDGVITEFGPTVISFANAQATSSITDDPLAVGRGRVPLCIYPGRRRGYS